MRLLHAGGRVLLWLPREDILTFEETDALVDVFVDLGVTQVRVTGGEPLLRKNVERLVRLLAAKPRIQDLALTTNAVLLARQARALKDAGLHRLTVSLDTLRPDRFRRLARVDALRDVLAGIEAAGEAGFAPLKIDTVVLRGVNDDEIGDLLDYARARGRRSGSSSTWTWAARRAGRPTRSARAARSWTP